jgi:hypothetical protein
MKYIIGTIYDPCTIVVKFRSLKPCTVRLQVSSAEMANTMFIDHIMPCMLNEDMELQVPMPLSPQNCIVSIYDDVTGRDDSFKLISIKKYGLRQFLQALDLGNQKLRIFIDFAQRFCYNAGVLPANTGKEKYCSRDPDQIYKLCYLPILINPENKMEDVTPARFDTHNKWFEASKRLMSSYTVPGRFCIMCHEDGHESENDDPANEKEADLTGLRTYLALGYSKIEAIKTYSTTFASLPVDDPNARDRYAAINNYIDDFYNEFYYKK